MKKCPFCAEEIQEEAVVCRYCRRDLVMSGPVQEKRVKQGRANSDDLDRSLGACSYMLIGFLFVNVLPIAVFIGMYYFSEILKLGDGVEALFSFVCCGENFILELFGCREAGDEPFAAVHVDLV